MPYTIELGGYWICNRGHTGYRHTALPTPTSAIALSPSTRHLHLAPCRNCEPFSRIEDVVAAQSLLARLNALFARESKGLPGVLVLTFSLPTLPLPGTRLTEYKDDRRRNLFASHTPIDRVLLFANKLYDEKLEM